MNSQVVLSNRDFSIKPPLFLPDALGISVTVIIGEAVGNVLTPRLSTKQDSPTGFRWVLPPLGFRDGLLQTDSQSENPMAWGHQVILPSGATYVKAFLFEFDIPKTENAARTAMTSIERSMDTWFGVLRDWIEVLTCQDLSLYQPNFASSDLRSRTHLKWSWQAESTWAITPASDIHRSLVDLPDVSRALTLEQWNKAVDHANLNQSPPESFLLLRDARALIKRGSYNYATILASIATEVVIKNQVESVLNGLNNPQPFIDQVLKNPLGVLGKTCKTLSVSLPSAFKTELVEVRNRAIHKNAAITREEAKRVLEMASQIVDNLAPNT